jgi:hypothetical protein
MESLKVQITFRSAPALPNRSAHTDTQQQVAAARHLLRAGGLQRWASSSRLAPDMTYLKHLPKENAK